MKKEEKAGVERQKNSMRIVNEVRSTFSREPEKLHLVYECRYRDVDLETLSKSHHPMSIVSPQDGREVATICFKRELLTPDYEYDPLHHGATWRP